MNDPVLECLLQSEKANISYSKEWTDSSIRVLLDECQNYPTYVPKPRRKHQSRHQWTYVTADPEPEYLRKSFSNLELEREAILLQQQKNNVELSRLNRLMQEKAREEVTRKIISFKEVEVALRREEFDSLSIIESESDSWIDHHRKWLSDQALINDDEISEYKKKLSDEYEAKRREAEKRAAERVAMLQEAARKEQEKAKELAAKRETAKSFLVAILQCAEEVMQREKSVVGRLHGVTDASAIQQKNRMRELNDSIQFSLSNSQNRLMDLTQDDVNVAVALKCEYLSLLTSISAILDGLERDRSEPVTQQPVTSCLTSEGADQSNVQDGAEIPPTPASATHEPDRSDPVTQHRQTNALSVFETYSRLAAPQMEVYAKIRCDPRLKSWISEAEGACRIILNAISANSVNDLHIHHHRMRSLLSGTPVQIAAKTIRSAEVANGQTFFRLFLAENFVTSVQSFDERELAMAVLLVQMSCEDADFRNVLVNAFHRKCPFTRPEYLSKANGESEQDFKARLGYKRTLGEYEDSRTYIQRMLYIVQLYSAVLVSRPMSGSRDVRHPFGYHMAWRWLASFLNLPPFSGYSAQILRAFLSACGQQLQYQYGAQFRKLMTVARDEFLPSCQMLAGDNSSSVGQLSNFLESYFKTGVIIEDCSLSRDFWF